MAFTTAEIWRIKAELGFNLLDVAADPLVPGGVSYQLESVVNGNIEDEVATTASDTVAVASDPTPVTLTLADATGFSAGARVFVDVDARQENVTIQALSGADITVQLSKAHSGTYPVALEGPIPLARQALARILAAKAELGDTFGEGALKRADEVEFYNTGGTQFGATGESVMYWRDELASILGLKNWWRHRRAAPTAIALY